MLQKYQRCIGPCLSIFLCSVVGCTPLTPPDTSGTVSFSTDIQPILTTTCGGCHSANGIADLSGIALRLTQAESYDGMVNQLSVQDTSLTLVIPGNSTASLVYQKVSSDAPPVGDRMPQFAPALSAAEILLIQNWIDQGALNN